MKKILSLLVIFFLFFAGLFLARNLIIKGMVETGVGVVTGLSLRMKSLDISLLKNYVQIEGLQLFNPKNFPDKVMVDLPEIYIECDLAALMKKKLHFPEIRIHLREFAVIKNENGQLNLDSLKPVQAQKQAPVGSAGETPVIAIDRLELVIERVVFKDYSSGGDPLRRGEPLVHEFNVNLHERYERITNPESLVNLIVFKALANTTIANLTHFDVGILKGPLNDTLATSTKLAGGAISKAGGVFSQVTGEAPDMAKNVASTVTNTVKSKASNWKSKLQKAVS